MCLDKMRPFGENALFQDIVGFLLKSSFLCATVIKRVISDNLDKKCKGLDCSSTITQSNKIFVLANLIRPTLESYGTQ